MSRSRRYEYLPRHDLAVIITVDRVVLAKTMDHSDLVILEGPAATAWPDLASGDVPACHAALCERWGVSDQLANAWIETILDQLVERDLLHPSGSGRPVPDSD